MKPLRRKSLRLVIRFIAGLSLVVFVLPFDGAFAQGGKKCVYNCVPPSAGGGASSGGGDVYIETESERLNNLGADASIQRDWISAVKYFEQAVRTDPNNAMAQRNLHRARGWLQAQLGQAARARGQRQIALRHLQQACQMLPQDVGAPICREYHDLKATVLKQDGLPSRDKTSTAAVQYYNYPERYVGDEPPVLPPGYLPRQPYRDMGNRTWWWPEAKKVKVPIVPGFDPKIRERAPTSSAASRQPKQVRTQTIGDCNAIREKEISDCQGNQATCEYNARKRFETCIVNARPGT